MLFMESVIIFTAKSMQCVYTMFMVKVVFSPPSSFNQLCLPEYTSCEQFHTSLMIALNEGSEGFGML